MISDHWYLLNIIFKFQLGVCNGCHDLMQKAKNFNDVAIVTVRMNDYRISFSYMSKDKAIDSLRNADLIEKSGTL